MWKNAFRFMVFDKAKMIGILFGIVISVFLIGAELGIFNSLLDNTKGITKDNPDYIFVVNKQSVSALALQNLDKRVGYELQSIEGVEKVYPIVLTGGIAKFASGGSGALSIIGIQAPDFVGGPKAYTPETVVSDLQSDGAVIVDKSDLENMENVKIGDGFSINNTRVFVSGISLNNAGFGQANVITTLERARKLAGLNSNFVNAYLVKTTTTNPILNEQIANNITTTIPAVKAATGTKFMEETLAYMKKASGIVISFGMLVGFALISGLVIVGLTLFSSVNDRIKDYGTIKAIGGGNGLITRLILIQSVLYAGLGFTIAMILLLGINLVMIAANQAMIFTPTLIIFLVSSTLLICLTGSYFSLRKILKLEPVQIFRM